MNPDSQTRHNAAGDLGPNLPANRQPLKPDQTSAREEAVTSSVHERLGRIEGLLNEVLHVLRDRKRRAGKRARTVGENAYRSVANDTELQATELEIAAARRILRKRGMR